MGLGDPTTLEEARKHAYGAWSGSRGFRYREGRCAFEVFPNKRGALHHQCERRNGHGLNGLWCRQHAKWHPVPA
jgi:hypothetical protein